jgi:hypothetical protein
MKLEPESNEQSESIVRRRRRLSTRTLAGFVVVGAVPVAALGLAQAAFAGGPDEYVNQCAQTHTAFPGASLRRPPHGFANGARALTSCDGATSKGWISAAIVVDGSERFYTGSDLGTTTQLSVGHLGGSNSVSWGCVHIGRNHAHHMECTWASS